MFILSQINEAVVAGVTYHLQNMPPPQHQHQTAIEKAVGMYRACESLAQDAFTEMGDFKIFMTSVNLYLGKDAMNNNQDALDVMLQLSLQYGIPVLVSVQVDGFFMVDHKAVLNVSATYIVLKSVFVKTAGEGEEGAISKKKYLVRSAISGANKLVYVTPASGSSKVRRVACRASWYF